jgi:hypothetical protein
MARILVVIALVVLCAPATADAQNLPNQFVCPREAGESNADWKFRCDEEESNAARNRGEILARQSENVAQQRAVLEKQPALPATRNRILGRWAMPASSRGAANDPFAGLSHMLTNGVCAILFGTGAVEFRADRWVLHDGDGATDLGPASYREGKDGIIYILPQKSLVQLLGLRIDTPDRLSVLGGATPCSMQRASPARGGAARGAPAPQPAGPVTPPAGPSRLMMVDDGFGYVCRTYTFAVLRCADSSDNAVCAYVSLGDSLRATGPIPANDSRLSLRSQSRSCKMQRVAVDSRGNVNLVE